MKEFKKWLENHKHANWTWEEDAEEAWRAALEWVSTFTISESIKRELEGR